MVVIADPAKFDWDKGNQNKNWLKHEVTSKECEEAFFDDKRKIFTDGIVIKNEIRYRMIGKTMAERLLFIVFTIRKEKVRIIYARDINRKEVYLYEEKT